MSIVIKEGDESAFIAYEEAFIHHLQHYWTTQPEMEAIPVIDIAASIEDVLYTEILKKHALPPTATLWSRSECILAFVDRVEKVKRCLDSKRCTQWKKLFETHAKHPMQILKVIQAEEVEKVSKPKVTKAPAIPKAPKAPTEKKPRAPPGTGPKSKGKKAAAAAAAAGPAMVAMELEEEVVLLDDFGFDFDGDGVLLQEESGHIDEDAWK